MQLTKAEIVVENEKLEARGKEFQAHFDRLDKENYDLKQELSDLKSHYKASHEIIKGRNGQIENLKKNLSGMTVSYKELRLNFEEVKNLSKVAADQAAESIKNVEFWVNQTKISKETARNIGTELLKAQQENKELWELLDANTKEVERLSGVEDALLSDIEAQKQHAQSMQNMINRLKAQSEEQFINSQEASEKITRLRDENIRLTGLLNEKDADIATSRRANSDLYDNLQAEIDLSKKFRSYLMISGGCLVGCIITLVYLLISRIS